MYCSCDVDCGAEVFNHKLPKAKKQHTCCECNQSILPGQFYERDTGMFEGEWLTFKTCLACLAIRNRCCPHGFYYGMLYETIMECLGYDYTDLPDYGYEFALIELKIDKRGDSDVGMQM